MGLFKNKYFYAVVIIIGVVFFSNILDASSSFDIWGGEADNNKQRCSELMKKAEAELENREKESYEQCKLFVEYDVYTLDAYSTYLNIIESLGFDIFLTIICPVLLVISFAFYVCKLFKSKIIKYYLLREDYKKFLKRIFINSYKSTLILPIFLIVTFLCSWKLSGHLIYEPYVEYSGLPVQFLQGMPLNAFFYIFNIVLMTGIIVSLSLINASKNKNPLLVVVETFIMFILLEFFNELVLEPVLIKSGFDASGVLFFNIYQLGGTWNILHCTIELLIYNFVIAIGVYFSFRDKEKLIQMCES